MAPISPSIGPPSPNTVSRNASLLKGARSPYSCPTPRYMTGVDVIFTTDRAAPPRASASLFVRIEPLNFTCS